MSNGFYCLDSEDDIIYKWFVNNFEKEPLNMNGHWYIKENEWDVIYKKAQSTAKVWIKDNVEQLIDSIHN